MDTPRAHEPRYALVVDDPQPMKNVTAVWRSAAQVATIGMFLMLVVAGLYFARAFLVPVVAAIVIGTTFAPVVKRARAAGISPWVTAVVLGVLLVAIAGLVITLVAAPISEWIGRAPEIGTLIKQKLYVLDRPLAALRDLQHALTPSSEDAIRVETPAPINNVVGPLVAVITPALAETMVFFVTLIFFLAAQMDFRRYLASFFESRDAKLRFLRIGNDIERNLASYVATVTVINFALGVIVTGGAWLIGYPHPLIFGILAMLLNYLPYVGAATMIAILFGVGLVTFPSLGHALIAPACFFGLAVLEGQIVTPAILGNRLTLSPFAVFLSLAFWAWLWGPMGVFLAVPLAIVFLITIHHIYPSAEPKLPD